MLNNCDTNVTIVSDGYKGIRIPEELTDEIDIIVDNKELGFSSRAEFVKEAVRRLLLDIKLYRDKPKIKSD